MILKLLLAAVCLCVLGAAAPARVVSLNPCLDVDLLALADRSQIAALSHYARNPDQSSVPREVGLALPITHETAEEILLLQPDLVLASTHTPLPTQQILKRVGIAVASFDLPATIEENFAQLREIASDLGQLHRGEALIAQIESALEAAAPEPGAAPVSALIYQPNGFSIGRGTVTDEMMGRAGLLNAAARYTRLEAANVPLEMVLADPPKLLLSGAHDEDWSWVARLLHHPALRHLTIARASYPQRLLNCGGPVLIESAAALASARKSIGP